jgi:uncharacterized delta-60 repeat protein
MSHRPPIHFALSQPTYWRRGSRITLISLALLLTSLGVYAAPGDLDPSFDSDGKTSLAPAVGSSTAWAAVIQADGKLLLGGQVHNGATANDFAVVRYLPNGVLDDTFNGTGRVLTPLSVGDDILGGLAVQSDGKIVAAGTISNATSLALARYHLNGVLDNTFDADRPPAARQHLDSDVVYGRRHQSLWRLSRLDPAPGTRVRQQNRP